MKNSKQNGTIQEWNAQGRRIKKGSRSVSRNPYGKADFDKSQTYMPKQNKSKTYSDSDEKQEGGEALVGLLLLAIIAYGIYSYYTL